MHGADTADLTSDTQAAGAFARAAPPIDEGSAERAAWFRTTAAVLHDELDYFGAPPRTGDGAALAQRADDARLTALCLSGGGIRSATFCLGALQALAGRRMLGQFHYLSTVSGGGFAGGWLQVFVRAQGGVGKAEAALARPGRDALARLRA